MSYLVCHFGKYKSSNVFGLQKHNQRENDNYSNMDIDKARKSLNYDLINKGNINYSKKIKTIIEANRASQRAIRKDATVYCECIVSSDSSFFERLTEDKQKKFFEVALDYLKDKIGAEFFVSANVHFDETTPHMHVGFVPIIENSLSAKKLIDRKFLREVQEQLPAYLKSHGFEIERGIEGSKRKHKDTKELKKELDREYENRCNDINTVLDYKRTLEEKIERLKLELNDMTIEYDEVTKALNKNSLNMSQINEIKVEPLFFSEDKIKIDKVDFERLKASALKAYTQHSLYATVSNQIENLKKQNEILSKESKEYYRKWNSALRDNSREIHEVRLKHREIISKKDDEILELKKELHQKNKFFDKYSLNGLYEKFKQNEIEREIERYRKQIKMEREKKSSYEMGL
ncbi:MobV family relaxase [Clostridium perfringens]|uniref:MobV family relaxase n=1 Tax=Clostridium perfringens TaxID=1502 RepID=UPI000D716D4D|nr:MobV family relaxase [Clostridium perfringens]PWX45548.1 hypothetical protein CYK61_15250 [Clostridium perfringens]